MPQHSESAHKEIMLIVMKMLNGKQPSRTERTRLAELSGFYRVKKGQPPLAKRHLPRITDSDFKDSDSMKRLSERILGRKIWVTPTQVKNGRDFGTSSSLVEQRKIGLHLKYRESIKTDPHMSPESFFENTTGIHFSSSEFGKRGLVLLYDTERRNIRRDLKDGQRLYVLKNIKQRLQHRINKHSKIIFPYIAASLSSLYFKHTKTTPHDLINS
jgi:hypothetical protein